MYNAKQHDASKLVQSNKTKSQIKDKVISIQYVVKNIQKKNLICRIPSFLNRIYCTILLQIFFFYIVCTMHSSFTSVLYVFAFMTFGATLRLLCMQPNGQYIKALQRVILDKAFSERRVVILCVNVSELEKQLVYKMCEKKRI